MWSKLKFWKSKPKFILKTGGEMTEFGLKIEMDWNDEFIEQAKRLGAKGHNDQEVVVQYLVYMLRSIVGVDEETGEAAPSIDATRPDGFNPHDENNRIVQ